MTAPWQQLPDVDRLWDALDPRLRESIEAELHRRGAEPGASLPTPAAKLVIAGHRAAGKTSLLPLFARWMGWPAVDLDRRIKDERRRSLREWVQTDEPGFRQAEREVFSELSGGTVVAVGGGFLAKSGAELAGHVTVLIPITFDTYRERLLQDSTRPRLRTDLSLEDELLQVYRTREALHAQARTVSLVDALLGLGRLHAR